MLCIENVKYGGPMRTTCRCGQSWTGLKLSHCTVCHRTFSTEANGDRHRTGQHHISQGPDRRRCRTDEELAAVGLGPTEGGNGSPVWRRIDQEYRFPGAGGDLESPDSLDMGTS